MWFDIAFIYFLISKEKYIKQKEETPIQCPLGIQGVYKSNPQTLNQGRGKNNPYPYLEPSHSKKLTREQGLKIINTLTQDHKLHTKKRFSLQSESTSSPKANKFLSFHTDQNIHKGAICHAFLRVFPTNAPCHPRRVSLTEPREPKPHQRGRKEDSTMSAS